MLVEELADFKITSISAGVKHSLCLTSEGQIYAWGCNQKGQLGLGEVKGALKPKRPKNVVEK